MKALTKILLTVQLVVFVVGLFAAGVAYEVSGLIAIFLLVISLIGIAGASAGFGDKKWSPLILFAAWALLLILQVLMVIEFTKDSSFDSKVLAGYISLALTAGFLFYDFKLARKIFFNGK